MKMISESSIAKILSIVSAIIIICGIIAGFVVMGDFGFAGFLIVALAFVFSGLLLVGFATLIDYAAYRVNKLAEISNKLDDLIENGITAAAPVSPKAPTPSTPSTPVSTPAPASVPTPTPAPTISPISSAGTIRMCKNCHTDIPAGKHVCPKCNTWND